MNLQKLNNEQLIANTKALVAEEKKITLAVLQHLREIERRNLHLKMGRPHLFDYATKDLGYSEHEANSRIAAMRLMKDVPEVEAKIASGSLSLSNAVKIQSHFYQTSKTEEIEKQVKLELIEKLENTSTRECERQLLKLKPKDYVPREKERAVTEDLIEVKIVMTKELKAKIEKAKDLLSHKKPNATLAEVLDMLCDDLIKKKDRTRSRRKASSAREFSTKRVPAAIERAVWIRDESCCSFQNGETRCGSTHLLEIDHVIPRHYGGSNDLENLRLLCFAHHQLVTEMQFQCQRARDGPLSKKFSAEFCEIGSLRELLPNARLARDMVSS